MTDAKSGLTVRYVRAKTLNAAVRALADETWLATAATTDDIFHASKAGSFDVLDAVHAE